MGCTGSGKSDVAERLADRLDALLINADAFQVFRGFDIGTNKPNDRSRYHLIDIADPTETFGVGLWVDMAQEILCSAFELNRDVIVVGGTGLYIRALFEEYDDLREPPPHDLRTKLMEREVSEGPDSLVRELLNLEPDTQVDLNNLVRVRRALERIHTPSRPKAFRLPAFQKHKLAVDPPLAELEHGLRERVTKMWELGWPEEVNKLLEKGVPLSAPAFRAIGYLSVASFLSGETGRQTTEEEIYKATRQYAKRQRTWLRSEPNLVRVETNGLSAEGIMQSALFAMKWLSVEEPEI